MNLPPSTPHPEMDALMAKAKAMPSMTPAELQAQRISFAFGNLPEGSTLTREDVAALDYAKYGNLAELTARAEAADAKSATLQATLDQTIHGWGEDAVKVAELQAQVAKLTAKLEEITDAVDGIYIFASDTLSGRTDGPDDREWQREGVVEIRNRAMVFATSATLRIVGD